MDRKPFETATALTVLGRPIGGLLASRRTFDGKRVTVIELHDMAAGVSAHGIAKVCPEDRPDADIGERLAMARAFQHLGRKLERQAWGRIKQADHKREQQERQDQRRSLNSPPAPQYPEIGWAHIGPIGPPPGREFQP